MESIIKAFCAAIEKFMVETRDRCLANQGSTTVEQVFSLHERYGIYTHPQIFLLIHGARHATMGDKNMEKTHLILNSIIDDPVFRESACSWAEIHSHVKYRFPKDVYDQAGELRTVIRKVLEASELRTSSGKVLEMRLTELQSGVRLTLLALGWLDWMSKAIPILRIFGNGHENYPYWSSADYFIKFMPALNQHISLLRQALISDLKSVGKKHYSWYESTSQEMARYLKEYNSIIFLPILKDNNR
ncbi:MAG: hypothetical protein WC453_01290 [Patescibacteria group bacterium]